MHAEVDRAMEMNNENVFYYHFGKWLQFQLLKIIFIILNSS